MPRPRGADAAGLSLQELELRPPDEEWSNMYGGGPWSDPDDMGPQDDTPSYVILQDPPDDMAKEVQGQITILPIFLSNPTGRSRLELVLMAAPNNAPTFLDKEQKAWEVAQVPFKNLAMMVHDVDGWEYGAFV
ncbi:hypothetical protein ACFX2I_036708 [Malus domestica]